MAIDMEKLLEEYDAVVFDKDNCGKCEQTEDLMRELNINFTTINMSQNKDALKKVKSDGHRSAPAVYTSTESWSSHNEDKIRELVGGAVQEEQDDDTWDF